METTTMPKFAEVKAYACTMREWSLHAQPKAKPETTHQSRLTLVDGRLTLVDCRFTPFYQQNSPKAWCSCMLCLWRMHPWEVTANRPRFTPFSPPETTETTETSETIETHETHETRETLKTMKTKPMPERLHPCIRETVNAPEYPFRCPEPMKKSVFRT